MEGKYFPDANDFDTEHDFYWYLQQDASKKLPGIGGVFNSVNLNPYCYAGDNSVKYNDPDGNALNFAIGAVIGFVTSASAEIADHWEDTGNGIMANFLVATKATFIDAKSLAIIGASTVIGAATSGLSAAVTTAKVTGTAAQIAKTVAINAGKNAAIGGTGAAANKAIQSTIIGEKITLDLVLGSFIEGTAWSGALSVTGDGVRTLGRVKFVDATFKAGGVRNPKVSYGANTRGAPAATGSSIPYEGEVSKSFFEIYQNKKSVDGK